MIKLLIGGSPCTHWSIAQKNNRETKAEGIGWELFENFLYAKQKFEPDFFLYENNKSAAQPIKDQISRELGVDLMYINSALVSAQNRQRFYAFNWTVPQPSDRGIILQDVLDSGLAWLEKSYAYTTRCTGAIPEDTLSRHRHTMVAEPVIFQLPRGKNQGGAKYQKSPTLTAGGSWQTNNFIVQSIDEFALDQNVCEAETIKKALALLVEKYGYVPEMFNAYNRAEVKDKSPTLSTGSMTTSSCATLKFEKIRDAGDFQLCVELPDKKKKPVYLVKDQIIKVNGKQYPINLADGFYILRKLTVPEACRLQTLPDDYCKAVSDAQAYKGIGNGWTAEVIIHILQGALKNIPRDEKILCLSMYDGIGTGRYCLEKMGFTNIEYHSFEIDKYAMAVANHNYPDIIQHGDAFQVRADGWRLEELTTTPTKGKEKKGESMSALTNIEITQEVRTCLADGKPALFHKWCDVSEIIAPSCLRGGHQGGVASDTLALVEYEDGSTAQIHCTKIKFTDNRAAQYCLTGTQT